MSTDGLKTYKPKELSELLGVSNECLRLWYEEGKIKGTTTKGGHRRYIYKVVEEDKRKSFIYARVSSSKQKDDLQRQISYLQERFPNHEVISDIGSGINFKRKGLIKLLECLLAGNIKEVVVAHKDRLCRFGFELFEYVFRKHGSILTILEDKGGKNSPGELADDLLSIITVFTAKYYGSRKYDSMQKGQDLPNQRAKGTVQQMPRCKQILLQSSQRLRKIKISTRTRKSEE